MNPAFLGKSQIVTRSHGQATGPRRWTSVCSVLLASGYWILIAPTTDYTVEPNVLANVYAFFHTRCTTYAQIHARGSPSMRPVGR